MTKKPNEVIELLTGDDKKLLNEVLAIEKKRLHIREIKNNTRNEKEIVSEIVSLINKAVGDEN